MNNKNYRKELMDLIKKWEEESLQAHAQYRQLRTDGCIDKLWYQGFNLACKEHIKELKFLIEKQEPAKSV